MYYCGLNTKSTSNLQSEPNKSNIYIRKAKIQRAINFYSILKWSLLMNKFYCLKKRKNVPTVHAWLLCGRSNPEWYLPVQANKTLYIASVITNIIIDIRLSWSWKKKGYDFFLNAMDFEFLYTNSIHNEYIYI